MIWQPESGDIPRPHPAVVEALLLLGKRRLALAIHADDIMMFGMKMC